MRISIIIFCVINFVLLGVLVRLLYENEKKTRLKIQTELAYIKEHYDSELKLIKDEVSRHIRGKYFIVKQGELELSGFKEDGTRIMTIYTRNYSALRSSVFWGGQENEPYFYLSAKDALRELKLEPSLKVIDCRTHLEVSARELEKML